MPINSQSVEKMLTKKESSRTKTPSIKINRMDVLENTPWKIPALYDVWLGSEHIASFQADAKLEPSEILELATKAVKDQAWMRNLGR